MPTQLEELEDDTTTLTSLELRPDGTFVHATTDGPLPSSVEGEWGVQSGTSTFGMIIRRSFQTTVGDSTYFITRAYTGTVEGGGGFVTVGGEILIDSNAVGYFKILLVTKDMIEKGPSEL